MHIRKRLRLKWKRTMKKRSAADREGPKNCFAKLLHRFDMTRVAERQVSFVT